MKRLINSSPPPTEPLQVGPCFQACFQSIQRFSELQQTLHSPGKFCSWNFYPWAVLLLSLWRPSCLSQQPGSLLRLLYALPAALQLRTVSPVSPRAASAALRTGAISSLPGGLLDHFTLLLEKQNLQGRSQPSKHYCSKRERHSPCITTYTCRCHGEGFSLFNFHYPDISH